MKFIQILTIIIFVAMVTKAQIFNRVEISTGWSLATQTSAYENGNRSQRETIRQGFNVMLRMGGRFNELLAFSSDIGYVQKGYRYEVEHLSSHTPSTFTTNEQTIHYITYSPQLKIGRRLGNFIPTVILGPRIDYQVGYGGEQKIDNLAHNFRKSIFGMNAGLDMAYAFGKVGITALFLYQFDFTKLVPTNSSTDLVYKNKVLILNLGLVYFVGD